MRYTLYLLLLAACAPATPSPSLDTLTPAPGCAQVALTDCGSTPGCAELRGVPLGADSSGECVEVPAPASEVLGCLDADVACPPAVVYARAGADQTTYEIAAGCFPAGWEDAGTAFPTCNPCDDIALDACGGTEGCQLLSARPVDDSVQACDDPSAPSEPLACVQSTDCAATPTVAEAPDGTAYTFPSDCVPPGWPLGPSYPACSSLCADLTLGDCSSVPGCAQIAGAELQDDGTGALCEDPSAPVIPLGCTDDAACADQVTYASDAGVTYVFPGTCVPAGFTVDTGTYGACP